MGALFYSGVGKGIVSYAPSHSSLFSADLLMTDIPTMTALEEFMRRKAGLASRAACSLIFNSFLAPGDAELRSEHRDRLKHLTPNYCDPAKHRQILESG